MFLLLVANVTIQSVLNGAARNEKVSLVFELVATIQQNGVERN